MAINKGDENDSFLEHLGDSHRSGRQEEEQEEEEEEEEEEEGLLTSNE